MQYISRIINENMHYTGHTGRQNKLDFKSRRISLEMQWDLAQFLKSQYVDNDKAMLGSVITLTGSALCAQATTCSDYVLKTWPRHGTKVIALLERAIYDSKHIADSAELGITVILAHGSCLLTIYEQTMQNVTEVFQQVIWMAAALRVAEADNV